MLITIPISSLQPTVTSRHILLISRGSLYIDKYLSARARAKSSETLRWRAVANDARCSLPP